MRLKLISDLLFRIHAIRNKCSRYLITRAILGLEGGEIVSKTSRRILRTYHGIEIGQYSYGGCFDLTNIPEGTIIGRYCSFGRDVKILNGNHPVTHKSLHPFFYNPLLRCVDKLLIERAKLMVGNDVWIGQGAMILPSVKRIGDGVGLG
jgi:acetyltransferase-like isoleucine patch superfamily enzyme